MNDKQTKEVRARLVNDIEEFLQEVMQVAQEVEEPRSPEQVGRKRILPSLVLWSGIVVAVLRGLTSQRAVWRLVGLEGLWDYPLYEVTDQAVYDRLAAGDQGGFKRVFEQVRDGLKERLTPYAQKNNCPLCQRRVRH